LAKSLVGKKILFIGPKTFGYEQEITKQLEKMGASVDYFDDRPFVSNIKKIILRIIPFVLRNEVFNYFQAIIDHAAIKQYDYVICIKLECFPHKLLRQLRAEQPSAVFLFYAWDSFRNSPNAKKCLDIFDRVYSFDNVDADKYELIHRPLFYIDKYKNITDQPKIYDVVFVGSVHIHRYKFIKSFTNNLGSNLNCYIFLYVPSKLLFVARKLLLFPTYGLSKSSEFKFSPLSQPEIIDLLGQTNIVLDFAFPSQDGLTMRSIEAFGARKKLITNNSNIRSYDFYNPENILVLDDLNKIEVIPESFINTPYKPPDDDIYDRYSIDGWVKEIFDLS
jgi:hypothetical protein